MSNAVGLSFVMGLAQTMTITFGILMSVLSIVIYLTVTERYSESLFGLVIISTLVSFTLGMVLLPKQDILGFIVIYGSIYLLPYGISNIVTDFLSHSDWVISHTYAFYGWLVGSILAVLTIPFMTSPIISSNMSLVYPIILGFYSISSSVVLLKTHAFTGFSPSKSKNWVKSKIRDIVIRNSF